MAWVQPFETVMALHVLVFHSRLSADCMYWTDENIVTKHLGGLGS